MFGVCIRTPVGASHNKQLRNMNMAKTLYGDRLPFSWYDSMHPLSVRFAVLEACSASSVSATCSLFCVCSFAKAHGEAT